MPCFQLKDAYGQTRWVEQGVAYSKVNGEEIVEGAIDWDCGEVTIDRQAIESYHFRKCSSCGEMGVYEST